MKTIFFFLAIILVSCGQTTDKAKISGNRQDSSGFAGKVAQKPVPVDAGEPEDQARLKMFWNEIVVPILRKDKKTVIENMDFPVTGDWTLMMKIDKEAGQATSEDFIKIYDKFFNDYFITELAKMNYSNLTTFENNDTTWYQISINRVLGTGEDAGEGAVNLIYYYSDSKFRLKNIQGVGGDFYFDL